jgi:hypothetical protein
MSEWYYRIDGKSEKGPLGSSKLVELIRAGTIKSDTEVRKGNSKWIRACEVNGLWNAAILPSVLFRCPHCEAAISKPPVDCAKCVRNPNQKLHRYTRSTEMLKLQRTYVGINP